MSHPSHRIRCALLASALILPFARTGAQQPDSTRDSTRRSAPAGHAHGDTAKLNTIRVIASPVKRPNAATSIVVHPDAIRTVPANDAWDIIRQTAGVEVHLQGQGPGFASDAVMRGYTSDHSVDVASFIDGVPLNEPVSGHAEGYADWNALIPEAVQRITVTKGPASPWAGNWAMGGTMEVTTEPSMVGTQWSARFGSYGDVRLAFMTGKEDPDKGFMVAADAQRSDGWRDNSQEAMGHALVNAIWHADGGRMFTLGVSTYGGSWDSPGYLTFAQYDSGQLKPAEDPTNGGSEIFGTVRGSVEAPAWGGALNSSLYAHGGDWHIFLTIPPEGGIGEGAASQTEEIDQRIGLGGTTRWSRQLGATHLMTGLDYRVVTAKYQRWYTTARARDSLYDFEGTPANLDALYVGIAPVVEAHWDLSSEFSLGLGARLDWLHDASRQQTGGPTTSADHWVASPKVSALYHVTPAFDAYASFNGGFRSPDGVIVQPGLPTTRENATEVGVRYASRTLSGTLALFLVNQSDLVTVDPVTLVPNNGGTTRQEGAELEGSARLNGSLTLFAHAIVNHARFVHLITDTGDTLSGKPIPQVANATVEGGLDFQRGLFLGSIWAAYTGPWTPVGMQGTLTAAYTLVNARATIPLPGVWSAVVGIQNILDTKYMEVAASGYVSPGQPRSVMLTIRHNY